MYTTAQPIYFTASLMCWDPLKVAPLFFAFPYRHYSGITTRLYSNSTGLPNRDLGIANLLLVHGHRSRTNFESTAKQK